MYSLSFDHSSNASPAGTIQSCLPERPLHERGDRLRRGRRPQGHPADSARLPSHRRGSGRVQPHLSGRPYATGQPGRRARWPGHDVGHRQNHAVGRRASDEGLAGRSHRHRARRRRRTIRNVQTLSDRPRRGWKVAGRRHKDGKGHLPLRWLVHGHPVEMDPRAALRQVLDRHSHGNEDSSLGNRPAQLLRYRPHSGLTSSRFRFPGSVGPS